MHLVMMNALHSMHVTFFSNFNFVEIHRQIQRKEMTDKHYTPQQLKSISIYAIETPNSTRTSNETGMRL